MDDDEFQYSMKDNTDELSESFENLDLKVGSEKKESAENNILSVSEGNKKTNSRLWYDKESYLNNEAQSMFKESEPSTHHFSSINGQYISACSHFLSKSDKTRPQNENREVNSFRFNFELKYDSTVEQLLYPKFYQKFTSDGYYVVQRTGSQRSVCLVCACELLLQRSTRNIVNHISGQKHMRKITNASVVNCLKNYHSIFLNLELNMQANQVYFIPDDDISFFKCVLCSLYVETKHIIPHILNEPHKSRVINLMHDPNVKNTFFLLDQQLQVYGVKNDIKPQVQSPARQDKIQREIPSNERPRRNQRRIMNGLRTNNETPHDIVKSVETPNDSNVLKTLPRRFNEHLPHLSIKGSFFTCSGCNYKKENVTKADIYSHLMNSSHLEATQLSLQDYIYFCEICDIKFHDEMTWELHFKNKPKQHQKLAASRKELVCEHECLTCRVIIYGDVLSLKRHQNSNARKIIKKKEVFLPEEVKKYLESKEIIKQNGELLLREYQKILSQQDVMDKCCREIKRVLSVKFEDCEVYPFGSRISGLGCSESDLDVFADIGRMYEGFEKQDEHNQFEIIKSAFELFRKSKEFNKITSRPTARTPIIRLKHKSTNLDCDISFRHGLSVENTKFLRFCFELQPVTQELILLLKKWALFCGLTENITTYAFAMMSIFYMQTKNYLVSVSTLKQLNPGKGIIIDGWETIAYTASIEETRKLIETPEEDIVELLKGFFKYYSEFSYKKEVVCPLLGHTILKSHFTDDMKGSLLHKEMATYIHKINTEESPEYFRSLSEFCIQDPFDLSHNLTKACSPSLVEKFKKLCTLSYEVMNGLN